MLLDYWDEKLPEWRMTEVEEHLADCDTCAGLARQVHELSSLMGKWTAKSHAEALKKARELLELESGKHS